MGQLRLPAASQVCLGICDDPSGAVGTFILTFVLILALLPPGLGRGCYSTSLCVPLPPKEAVMIGSASWGVFRGL